MVVKESSRVHQELSLFVWLVMTCSARVGLSRSAVSHGGHLRYRVTDKQTNKQTDPTTVPSLRMRAEGNNE